MIYLDPKDHEVKAATFPYWLSFKGEMVDKHREQKIKEQMTALFDEVAPNRRRWIARYREGWFYLMFRDPDDRDLARFAL